MAQFMLLIRGDEGVLAAMSPTEIEATLGAYFAWTDRLRAEGRLLGSEELQRGGRVIQPGADGLLTDGPYIETKEGIGGYYLITAADEDEAVAVARDCPAFGHGAYVEVRGIVER